MSMSKSYALRNRVTNMMDSSTQISDAMISVNTGIAEHQAQNAKPGIINYNALLPSFGGRQEENLDYFLSQFRQIAVLANWPKESWTIILKSRLHGDALALLATDSLLQQEQNFEKISLMLQNYFQKEKSFIQKQDEFKNIKQTPQMSVNQLAQKIQSAAKAFLNFNENSSNNELINNLLLSRFSEALIPELSWDCLLYTSPSPRDGLLSRMPSSA